MRPPLQVAMLLAAWLVTAPSLAQVRWYWDSSANPPPQARARITESMNEAVAHYNAFALYDWQDYATQPRGIRVTYDPNVPTANAIYRNRISFGPLSQHQGVSTAMHEMGHVFGVGTFEPTWTNLVSGQKWQGALGNAELQRYDGAGATINADVTHFWPYGLNFSSEDTGLDARMRHVRVIGALREDMGLNNGNGTELIGDYNNDGVTDAADYTIYRDRLGEATSLVNDRTIGSVDSGDYSWWRRGYGRPAPSSGTAIPEPAALGLALLALAAAPARRRR